MALVLGRTGPPSDHGYSCNGTWHNPDSLLLTGYGGNWPTVEPVLGNGHRGNLPGVSNRYSPGPS